MIVASELFAHETSSAPGLLLHETDFPPQAGNLLRSQKVACTVAMPGLWRTDLRWEFEPTASESTISSNRFKYDWETYTEGNLLLWQDLKF